MPNDNPFPPSPQVTDAGTVRCRFDMFIRLRPEAIVKGKSATWCHRGDKYANEPDRMLQSLLKMFMRHHSKYILAELYDNTKPKNDVDRVILKFNAGTIEINKLAEYKILLSSMPIPNYLQ